MRLPRQVIPWVPRRRYGYGKIGTVYESENNKIWVSWGRHGIAFHLSVGPWSLMKLQEPRKE